MEAVVSDFSPLLFGIQSFILLFGFFLIGFVKGVVFGDPFRTGFIHFVGSFKLYFGLWVPDKNLSLPLRFLQIISGFTWECIQNIIGFWVSIITLIGLDVRSIELVNGIVLIRLSHRFGAFALGRFIIGDNSIEPDPRNLLFQHEYGHVLQSRVSGPLYLFKYGIPSLISAYRNQLLHSSSWVEQDANRRAKNYWDTYVADEVWSYRANPIIDGSRIVNPKWWEFVLFVIVFFGLVSLPVALLYLSIILN